MTKLEAVEYLEAHEFILPVSATFLKGSVWVSVGKSVNFHGGSLEEAVERLKERYPG